MTDSLLSTERLLGATGGRLLGKEKELSFTSVATDSRNVTAGSLFVPLVGEFQDGHAYIPAAVENGASVVFLNEAEFQKKKETYEELAAEKKAVAFVCVEHTLHALQAAAAEYVRQFPSLVRISVTGSSGKTTTKEMLVSVLKEQFGDALVYTQGNLNSETGLPLSVFAIRPHHKVGVFELGMNRVGEMAEISAVLRPQFGIITNIGTAHIGLLGSRQKIAEEKRKSFAYIPQDGAAFVPADDDFADFCVQDVRGAVVKFGRSVSEAESGVRFVQSDGLSGTDFVLDGTKIHLPLCGEYNYQNALGVVACARRLGLSAAQIKNGLEKLRAVPGRMELEELTASGDARIRLLKDCYNANMDSMLKAIDFCCSLDMAGKKIFVLGDMKELGDESRAAHEAVGKRLLESPADVIFLVGEEMQTAFAVLDKKKDVRLLQKSDESFAKIARDIVATAGTDALVLLKGSHSMELEKIVPLVKEAVC